MVFAKPIGCKCFPKEYCSLAHAAEMAGPAINNSAEIFQPQKEVERPQRYAAAVVAVTGVDIGPSFPKYALTGLLNMYASKKPLKNIPYTLVK